MRIKHQPCIDEEYWSLYLDSPCGRAGGADHERNYPLFEAMAREWDIVAELPLYIPAYLNGSLLVDHVRKYRTGSNQTVYVFSPYFDTSKKLNVVYGEFMCELLRLEPLSFGVYFPNRSYYHPNTFTFVFKGRPGNHTRPRKSPFRYEGEE